MANPNILAETLKIQPDERKALCDLEFADRRYTSWNGLLERPVRVTLANGGFEATFLASYEDMKAMRDWLNTAMAAIEAQDAEAA